MVIVKKINDVKNINFQGKLIIILEDIKCYDVENFTGKFYDEHNKCCLFLKDNKYHRFYGPTVICYNKYKEKSWYFNKKLYGSFDKSNFYNQKQFIKDLNKQWLL